MKAERLEDLGRIREKLDQLLNIEFCGWGDRYKRDRFVNHYLNNDDGLEELGWALSKVRDGLLDCLTIAQGDEE